MVSSSICYLVIVGRLLEVRETSIFRIRLVITDFNLASGVFIVGKEGVKRIEEGKDPPTYCRLVKGTVKYLPPLTE